MPVLSESAVVEAVDGDAAWVSTRRRSACGSCDARSACGSGTLSKVFGGRFTRLKVRNPVNAQPGDQVTVAIAEQALLRGAIVMYLIPLLLFFLFGALAHGLAGDFAELITILASAAGLLLGFRLASWLAARQSHNLLYQAEITAVEQPLVAGARLVYYK